MPKFTVPVCRIGYSIKEIEVDANSQEEADRLALEQAPSELFGSEHASDYQLEGDVSEPNRVLVHLMGGVVQDIFADRPSEVNLILRDFDIEGSEFDIAEDEQLFTDGSDNYQEVERSVSPWKFLDVEPFAKPVKPEDLK